MVVFRESRSLRETWAGWVVLLGGIIALSSGLMATLPQTHNIIASGRLFTDWILPIATTITVFAFCLYLFVAMRIDIIIDEFGIRFKFLPFIRKKEYPWSEIAYAWVRKYGAVREYGGWGYRGIGRKRRAYTLGERYGIQIITLGGNDILIGTTRPEAAQAALKGAGKGEPPDPKWRSSVLRSFWDWLIGK